MYVKNNSVFNSVHVTDQRKRKNQESIWQNLFQRASVLKKFKFLLLHLNSYSKMVCGFLVIKVELVPLWKNRFIFS